MTKLLCAARRAAVAVLAVMIGLAILAVPSGASAAAGPLCAKTAALAASLPAPDKQSQSRAAETAYFEMTDITRERFVIKLTDPAKIAHARRILSGEETQRVHVIGRIIKRTADYNPRWSFHFNPDTIDFFEVAIEVCDSTIPYTEDHLDEACGPFLPGCVWCPWTSRLTRELGAQSV
ncbi:calmodulin-binding protein [Nonomuraea sp. NPDC050790]|uniref:BP74-related protein n=1 Tax=Nonomuraea sp. NPDC050790 TaxID=3364371 RepID=UPI00379CE5B3